MTSVKTLSLEAIHFQVLRVRTSCESGGTQFSQTKPEAGCQAGGSKEMSSPFPGSPVSEEAVLSLAQRGGGGGLQASKLTCSVPPPSSSDAELDHADSEASNAEPSDERPQRLELQLPPLLKPLTTAQLPEGGLTRAVSPYDLREPKLCLVSIESLPGRETGLPGLGHGGRSGEGHRD